MPEATATTPPSAVRESLAESYRAPAGVFDEMRAADGAVRPHWRGLVGELDALGSGELRQREETARRIIHEQGITYNVYGDPHGRERPWQLDLIPFVLEGGEWSKLEAGLVQRATLFERILADCYGPQELVRSGWMPPALLFAQPDFLRPMHGIKPPGGSFLHFYAADVARSPDGRWWVLSDRTQIPTGSGYALANRLVSSRVLSEAFRNCGVQRLAGYFRQLQQTLGGLASRRTEEPRVVLLTPGPFNETYFEQGYLARYLGYTLVEGQDLTVRDARVYLKTLSGLERVDVILRRVDDDFCDPLELRSDSMLGVPGLIDALRAGQVAVANAPGTGLLQSPAFMSFLPGLCRRVLGQELHIPSVATWWCGQKPAEKYVLEKLAQLEVRPAFRLRQPLPAMTAAERRERIRFAPHLWAAQERVPLSTVPYWEGNALVPRAAALRVYLVARPDGGYVAMPGGLTRLGDSQTAGHMSLQRGGASKDTWVLSSGPVEEISLLQPAGKSVELRRVGNNLPSRLADNFFWLGRYAERADATARLLRSALLRFTQESLGTAAPLLQPILETLERQGQLPPKRGQTAEALEAVLVDAVYSEKEHASLRSLTERVERLAMQVRDRTSNDVWRALSSLVPAVTREAGAPPALAAHAIVSINQLILQVASFHGMARENMTRAQSWRFLDMGQRIERAIYLCTFLDEALQSPQIENPSVLETVLEAADSTLTYRSRYNLLPNLTATFDLVLLDDTNPRSLLFQLLQLVKHFDRLPRERQSALPSAGERILIELVARARLLDPHELAQAAAEDRPETETARVIRESLRDLPRLAEALAVSYFAHSTISHASA